jgi:hypothetical protein
VSKCEKYWTDINAKTKFGNATVRTLEEEDVSRDGIEQIYIRIYNLVLTSLFLVSN